MKARDIIMRPVVAASPDTFIRDAAMQMLIGGFSGMPVVNRDGALVGVVTEFDIIRAIRHEKPPEETTVEDVMTDHVISVDADASLDEVITLMDTAHIVRVPVTKGGRLFGVVARPDILRAYFDTPFARFDRSEKGNLPVVAKGD